MPFLALRSFPFLIFFLFLCSCTPSQQVQVNEKNDSKVPVEDESTDPMVAKPLDVGLPDTIAAQQIFSPIPIPPIEETLPTIVRTAEEAFIKIFVSPGAFVWYSRVDTDQKELTS